MEDTVQVIEDKLVDSETQEELLYLAEMGYTKREYSPEQYNQAGQVLKSEHATPEELNDAHQVVHNFRTSHSFPLLIFRIGLHRKATSVYPSALIAQRLKRLSSIKSKLSKEDRMRLTQMQDIGGCRAIVQSVSQVETLRRIYRENVTRGLRHKFATEDDYIERPREISGYRSIHLVYRYHSDDAPTYDGLKIEVQLRSRLQHAWATAVETAGEFMQQALKSSVGPTDWLRFFKLMGSAHAIIEKRNLVAGTPTNRRELKAEIRKHYTSLQVESCLRGYSHALQVQTQKAHDAYYFLLKLDTVKRMLYFWQFSKARLADAQAQCQHLEKQNADASGIHVVLVSVDKLKNLRRAYPNYFLDTDLFIESVQEALRS